MIKDLSIIGFIITFVILSHIYVQDMLKEDSNEVIGNLNSLKQELELGNIEKLKENAKNTYDNWKKKSDIWSVIVDHEEVDVIEAAILDVKTRIEKGETDTIYTNIDEAIFLVSLIEDKEKLSLKNLF